MTRDTLEARIPTARRDLEARDSFSDPKIAPCPADGAFVVALVVALLVGYLQGTVGFTG